MLQNKEIQQETEKSQSHIEYYKPNRVPPNPRRAEKSEEQSIIHNSQSPRDWKGPIKMMILSPTEKSNNQIEKSNGPTELNINSPTEKKIPTEITPSPT